MRAPVRHFHRIVKWVATAIGSLIVVPVFGQFGISIAENWGWYKHPDSVVASMSTFFASITGSPWFHWIGGGVIGLAVGLWLDFLVIRTSRQDKVLPKESGVVYAQRTVLRLSFSGLMEAPRSIYEENILSWFAYWSPGTEIQGNQGEVLSKILPSWVIFIAFEKPDKYHQIVINFLHDRPLSYEVRQQLTTSTVITISGGMPACEMEVLTR